MYNGVRIRMTNAQYDALLKIFLDKTVSTLHIENVQEIISCIDTDEPPIQLLYNNVDDMIHEYCVKYIQLCNN